MSNGYTLSVAHSLRKQATRYSKLLQCFIPLYMSKQSWLQSMRRGRNFGYFT